MEEKNSHKSGITIISVVLGAAVVLLIYFAPYLLADGSSQGWFETGKYAEANLYPDLAMDSYKASLACFPVKSTTPRGSVIDVADKRRLALKENLSGIPFPRINELLVEHKFQELAALVKGEGFAIKNFLVDYLDEDVQEKLDDELRVVRQYFDRVLPVSIDGEIMYSDDWKASSINALNSSLMGIIDSYVSNIAYTHIFDEKDQADISKAFKPFRELVNELDNSEGIYKKLDKLELLFEEQEDVLQDMVKARHVTKIANVGRYLEQLKRDIGDFKVLSQAIHTTRSALQSYLMDLDDYDKLDQERVQALKKKLKEQLAEWKKSLKKMQKNSKRISGELEVDIPGLAILEKLEKEWEQFLYESSRIDRYMKAFWDAYQAKQNELDRLKVARRQADSAEERKEARTQLQAVSREMQNMKFLPLIDEGRGRVINGVLSYERNFLNSIRDRLNYRGMTSLRGTLERESQNALAQYRSYADMINRTDDGEIFLIRKSYTAEGIRNKMENVIEGLFSIIYKRNKLVMKENMHPYNPEGLKTFFERTGYWESFGEEYLEKNRWRLEYAKMKSGQSSAAAEEILKRIRNFSYFYDDTGFFGSRYETVKMNKHLVPVALELARQQDNTDLAEELEEFWEQQKQ